MVLGDAFSTLETFVWILNCISRSITWSLLTLEESYLVLLYLLVSTRTVIGQFSGLYSPVQPAKI